MAAGRFGTAINCMDGRVQEPVLKWMKARYGLDYVDMITEPGPIKLMTEEDPLVIESIQRRVRISVEKHHSNVIAVAGHHDCAGNPVAREQQAQQIRKSIERLKTWNLNVTLVGLYVSDDWSVTVVQE
jgi:carbonic anhydrase